MLKIYFAQAECCGEWVRYYLLQEFVAFPEIQYGIAVEYGPERITIRKLSVSLLKTKKLLWKMADGCVTPAHVRDIVEDWLAL